MLKIDIQFHVNLHKQIDISSLGNFGDENTLEDGKLSIVNNSLQGNALMENIGLVSFAVSGVTAVSLSILANYIYDLITGSGKNNAYKITIEDRPGRIITIHIDKDPQEKLDVTIVEKILSVVLQSRNSKYRE